MAGEIPEGVVMPEPDAVDLMHEVMELREFLRLEREARQRAEYFLKIFVHAHGTGNSAPPHLEQEARAALSPREETAGEHFGKCGPFCSHVKACEACVDGYSVCAAHQANPDETWTWRDPKPNTRDGNG